MLPLLEGLPIKMCTIPIHNLFVYKKKVEVIFFKDDALPENLLHRHIKSKL